MPSSEQVNASKKVESQKSSRRFYETAGVHQKLRSLIALLAGFATSMNDPRHSKSE
jgi:hypothetical protein